MNDTAITDVSTLDVPRVWEHVVPLLELALDRSLGEYTLEAVYSGLMYEMMRLWIILRDGEIICAGVTEIRSFPKRRIAYVVLMGGHDMDSWRHHITAVEQWAYENGADVLVCNTRRGIVKPMKEFGYSECYTLIAKELRASGVTH